MNQYLKVNEKDNVVTALRAMEKGEKILVDGKEVFVVENIPRFHKIAIADIPKGGIVYKYGQVIGDALEEIKAGAHVHVHNLESTRGRGDKKER